jgi:hypothetical protein
MERIEMKSAVSDKDVKVAVALGGGKSHDCPIHPAMRKDQPAHTVSAQPSEPMNVGVGVGR